MRTPTQVYKDTANVIIDPREVEASLLYRSASRLQAIQDQWEEKAKDLRDALIFNRRLWAMFLASVTRAENPLPKEIRENVANLGIFVFKHTVVVETNPQSNRLSVLISINRNVAAGLMSR